VRELARKQAEEARAAASANAARPSTTAPTAVAPTTTAPTTTATAPVTTAAPAGPMTKQQKMAELNALYKADKVTPAEYHKRRAEILAQP
jgi:hypothetical protein